MTESLKGAEVVRTTEHVFETDKGARVVQANAMAQPTQLRRPWRSTLRTVFQALVGLAAMWAVVVQALGLPDWAWVGTSLAVAAGITRVMALPAVEVWLRTWVPWLAAAPKT